MAQLYVHSCQANIIPGSDESLRVELDPISWLSTSCCVFWRDEDEYQMLRRLLFVSDADQLLSFSA